MGKSKALETALNNKLLSSHEHLKKGVFSPPPSSSNSSGDEVIVLGWEVDLEPPFIYNFFIAPIPSHHYYGYHSSFIEDLTAPNLNYNRWRTQISTRTFESDSEKLD